MFVPIKETYLTPRETPEQVCCPLFAFSAASTPVPPQISLSHDITLTLAVSLWSLNVTQCARNLSLSWRSVDMTLVSTTRRWVSSVWIRFAWLPNVVSRKLVTVPGEEVPVSSPERQS